MKVTHDGVDLGEEMHQAALRSVPSADETLAEKSTRLEQENRELRLKCERLEHQLERADEWADGVASVATSPPWRAR